LGGRKLRTALLKASYRNLEEVHRQKKDREKIGVL
jgi:hypothetical protein